MSRTVGREWPARRQGGPQDLRLVNWPLREDPGSAWPILAVAVGAAILAGAVVDDVATGLLSFTVLAASLWRLWIPVRFEFSPRGVTQAVLGRRWRIPWPDVPCFEVRERGVLLLPSRQPLPLARLRGLYVRFAGRREELLASVSYYVGPLS